MKLFYEPTAEHLTRLSEPWCCSFSGGKDSTSLVTWIEWLRRSGWIDVAKPQLVQSDTTVEYPALQAISREMMAALRKYGWECAVVEPELHEKLYNQILGRGLGPIHAAAKRTRWCTRSTKIDPMMRWHKANSHGVMLTGLRMGESTMRDGKLKKRGCSAGGECGIPDPSDRTYSPILHWATCHVIDWLNGLVGKEIRKPIDDLVKITRKLIEIYDIEVDRNVFDWADPIVTAARFGCNGCPAIMSEAYAPRSSIKRHGKHSPLNEIYAVWFEARRSVNRLAGIGPIKMEIRKVLFERVMDIQRRAGVILITPEDEAFIRKCWANKVYPRGWSEEDEATPHPEEAPLFAGE